MVSANNKLTSSLLALLLVHKVQAQYFSVGNNALVRTRLDPIVNPGTIGSHVHLFAGTNAIDSNMNHASATAGDCTTSPISVDKSGYWAPQLYYKWKNGTYSAMSGDGLVTYWLNRGNDVAKGEVSAVVPDDFRMVAGNMTRDFLDVSIPSHDAVQYQCFGPGYDHLFHYIPADFDCDTIRPQIFFPNCWNGKDSYKADNSHVSYPLGNYQGGTCPPGFKRIPSLFMEAYYKPKISLGPEYEWYPGCFVLSNGDNFGLTYHADWLNGFPKGLLVDAFKACPNMAADPAGCFVLKPFIQSIDKGNCQMKGQIVDEAVGIQAPLLKLPGNNPEFNSSRLSSKPRQLDPNFVDTADLITLDITKGGSCFSQKCTDYIGRGGEGLNSTVLKPKPTTVKGPKSTASKPSKSSATSKASSTKSGALQSGVMLAGDQAVGDDADMPKPVAGDSASKPSGKPIAKGDGSKKTCKRQKRGRERKRRL